MSSKTLDECIQKRQSHRKYKDESISFEELSYLVKQTSEMHSEGLGHSRRVIPTAGATHSMETYLYIYNVEGIKFGLYRYLPNTKNLELLDADEALYENFNNVFYRQLRNSAVTFIWTCVPGRCEYKYSFTAHKMMAMEAGHVCQNLYLACEALDLGCVAIGSYNQIKIDDVMKLNIEEEFVLYAGTVGKI